LAERWLTPSRHERQEGELISAPQAPFHAWDWRCAPKKILDLLALVAAWREHSFLKVRDA
jgi:hypothetical protein